MPTLLLHYARQLPLLHPLLAGCFPRAQHRTRVEEQDGEEEILGNGCYFGAGHCPTIRACSRPLSVNLMLES